MLPEEVWPYLAASFTELTEEELEDEQAIADFLEAFVLDAFHEQEQWPPSEDAEHLLAFGQEIVHMLRQVPRSFPAYDDDDLLYGEGDGEGDDEQYRHFGGYEDDPDGPSQGQEDSDSMAYANLPYAQFGYDAMNEAEFSGGQLELLIAAAEGLRGPGGNSTADPYVKVLVTGMRQVFKTEPQRGTLDPAWNSSCSVDVSADETFVILTVLDGNRTMGHATLDLLGLSMGAGEEFNLSLDVEPDAGCPDAEGLIHVRASFNPAAIT